MILSAQQLDYTYRHESDANVRERIFLVRRVRVDGEEAECTELDFTGLEDGLTSG